MSTHLSQYHLVERIQHQIAHCSGRTALREWYASGEMQLTWFQAGARIRRIASALLSLGIDAQERVALFSHNSLNWSLADLATLYVRGVTVPIYATNTATQAAFIINDADIRTIFVGSQPQYDAILALLPECPQLKRIIVLDDNVNLHHCPLALTLAAFEADVDDAYWQPALQQRIDERNLDDLFTLIYTSGTTGEPKGVMLDYANMAMVLKLHDERLCVSQDDISLSFLPLSHVFERAWSFYMMHTGIAAPWWLFSLLMQAAVVTLCIAKVELGGKVLGVLMLMEVGIVLLVDAAIVTQPIAFDISAFTPSTVFHGDVGIAMIFAICSFVGFEATAIYSEECRQPAKVIPRATLLAVVLITSFFALSGWAFVQYAGAAHVAELAANDPGMFVFTVTEQVLGQWAIQVMSVLLITGLFAATQAFHSTLFAISRDGLLWSKMAKTHRTHQTPYIASLVQGTFMLCATALFALAQLDPMANVFSWASALGSMSILVLQFSVSLAVLAYFQRNPALPVSRWSRLIAPALSALGMLATLALVVNNLDVLSGSSSPVVSSLPYLVLLVAFAGFMSAHFLRRLSPERYSRIGQMVETL